MADRPAGFWLRLARFLPADVRERVFEPAYFDLVLDEFERVGGEAGAAAVDLNRRVAFLLVDVSRIALTGLFWRNGKTTLLSRGLAVMAIILITLAVLDMGSEPAMTQLIEY